MLDGKTLVKVTNRDNGVVGYSVPDLNNLHRNFQPGEKQKEVTVEEIRNSYLPGGIFLTSLVVKNEGTVRNSWAGNLNIFIQKKM